HELSIAERDHRRSRTSHARIVRRVCAISQFCWVCRKGRRGSFGQPMDHESGEAPFREDDAHAAFEEGDRLAKRGDLEGAEGAYRRADEAGHPTAAAYAGVFDEAHGETAKAEQSYRRADERGDGFGAFRLGLLLSQAGDW